MSPASSVAAYLDALPGPSRAHLEALIAPIREELPGAEEAISYGVIGFRVEGRVVVWAAGYARHASIHPIGELVGERLAAEIAPHVAGRGTLRFALGTPVPAVLVRRIVRLRLEEVRAARRR